jgi:hypothetical protein
MLDILVPGHGWGCVFGLIEGKGESFRTAMDRTIVQELKGIYKGT